MAKRKILIVEDEKDIIEVIEYNLKKEGHEVLAVKNGQEALSVAKRERPDLIVLDIMLPDIDGLEVCKRLRVREETACIPIIILSAKSQEVDKIIGLELGADDYVTKPFSPRELLARIKAVLRRHESGPSQKDIRIGDLFIDHASYRVMISDREIELTPTEFKLLAYIADRPGLILSRDKLLDGVFGYDATVYGRTVDAHIKSLRKKLGNKRNYIKTVRGVGYRFEGIGHET